MESPLDKDIKELRIDSFLESDLAAQKGNNMRHKSDAT